MNIYTHVTICTQTKKIFNHLMMGMSPPLAAGHNFYAMKCLTFKHMYIIFCLKTNKGGVPGCWLSI